MTKRPQVTGYHGPIEVESIKPMGLLGGRTEGQVERVQVTFRDSAGTHTELMAEKRFREGSVDNISPFANPQLQFETIRDLVRDNREKELGLRIIPTLWLRQMGHGKKPRLMMTELDTIESEDMLAEERRRFISDAYRQIEIADNNGYLMNIDSFIPVRDRQHGIVAVISDFGSVMRKM